MRLLYFAWVREAIGIDREERDVRPGTSVSALIDQMAAEDPRYVEAFADRSKLRFAVDQKMVREGALLDGAEELAIFPPVTGG
jgi:sulfur-carrier protein